MDTATSTSSIATGVVRNDALIYHAPSPPSIFIPNVVNPNDPCNTITPAFDIAAPHNLSAADVHIITGGRTQTARNERLNGTWHYHNRRKAQLVLDFLFLGPTNAIRDQAWLEMRGITMLLVVRDLCMVNVRLRSIDSAVENLNIELEYIDWDQKSSRVEILDRAIQKINQHMLNRNTLLKSDPDAMPGTVLVTCETGNERSASIVVAYLMAMYGLEMVPAIQFLHSQRFCVNLTDSEQQLLITYHGLLRARSVKSPDANNVSMRGGSKKRGIQDTLDADDDGDLDMDYVQHDERSTFNPFTQESDDSDVTLS